MNKYGLSFLSWIIFSSLVLSMSPYLWRLKFENGYIIYIYNHKKRTSPKNIRKMAFSKLSEILKDVFQIEKVNFYKPYCILKSDKFIIKIPFQSFFRLNLC